MEFGFAIGEAEEFGVGHHDLVEPVRACAGGNQSNAATWVGEELPQPGDMAAAAAEGRVHEHPIVGRPRLPQAVVGSGVDLQRGYPVSGAG